MHVGFRNGFGVNLVRRSEVCPSGVWAGLQPVQDVVDVDLLSDGVVRSNADCHQAPLLHRGLRSRCLRLSPAVGGPSFPEEEEARG